MKPFLTIMSQVAKAMKAAMKNTPEGQAAMKAAKARLEGGDDAWDLAMDDQGG